MKLYFYVYPSAFQNPGGGEVQLVKTREYLQKRGLKIHLFNPWEDRLREGDLLHVFGSVKYCLDLVRVANARGVKVALSTIAFYDLRSAWHTYSSLRSRALTLARHLAKSLFPWIPSMRKELIERSDLILPNSLVERDEMRRYFLVPADKMAVIPNGVDSRYAQARAEPFVRRYGLRDFVLCVGRIEPRKNQLALVRALKNTDLTLVFIGEPVARYGDYYGQCRSDATGRMHFLGAFDPDSELLVSAYAACNTFALPSWFETPGLAALEASLAGAKLVITEGGATREYFGDRATYVRPHRIPEIREAVQASVKTEKNGRLREHILKNFLWEETARKTEEAYRRLVALE